jgi:hypothetical protein
MELVKNFKFIKKSRGKTGTYKTTPSQWNDFARTCLPILIPCLEFTIEIESNNLMYNPNKAIRDKVFPVKIGKFSVKYYTFDELQ